MICDETDDECEITILKLVPHQDYLMDIILTTGCTSLIFDNYSTGWNPKNILLPLTLKKLIVPPLHIGTSIGLDKFFSNLTQCEFLEHLEYNGQIITPFAMPNRLRYLKIYFLGCSLKFPDSLEELILTSNSSKLQLVLPKNLKKIEYSGTNQRLVIPDSIECFLLTQENFAIETVFIQHILDNLPNNLKICKLKLSDLNTGRFFINNIPNSLIGLWSSGFILPNIGYVLSNPKIKYLQCGFIRIVKSKCPKEVIDVMKCFE